MTSAETIELGGDATKLIAAYKAANQAAEDNRRKSKQAYEESKAQAREEAQLAKEVERIRRSQLTPVQLYGQEIAKLKNLLTQQLITEQQFSKEKEKQLSLLKQRKEDSPEGRQRAAEAAQKEADAVRRQAESRRMEAAATKEQAAAQKALEAANARALADLERHEKEALQRKEQLKNAGKAVWNETRTPLEKYNAEMSRLTQLQQKGAITQDTFNRAAEKQKKIYESTLQPVESLQSKAIGFGKEAVVAFTGIGTALAGVMATVNIIKTEYEDLKRRQKESLDSQLSFGDQMREMAVNFGEDQTLKKGDLEQVVLDIAQRTGATPETVAQVLGPTLSAKGDLTNAQAAGVVEQALRVLPTNAEASTQLASRAADLMGAGGVDARSAIGVLTQAQQKARVTNLRDLGQSGVPAMVATMAKGDSLEASAELFTTINALMNDAEGNRSRTATEALNVRLAEFSPQRRSKDSKGKFNVSQQAIDQFGAAKTTTERIAVMRQNADLRRSFLGSASFELGAQATIESLLSGDDRAMGIERGVKAGITAPNANVFEGFIGGLNQGSSQDLVSKARAAAGIAKRSELADAGSADALAREVFDKALGRVDFAGPDALVRTELSSTLWGRTQLRGQDTASAAADILSSVPDSSNGSGMTAEHLAVLRESADLLRQISARQQAPPENALGRK